MLRSRMKGRSRPRVHAGAHVRIADSERCVSGGKEEACAQMHASVACPSVVLLEVLRRRPTTAVEFAQFEPGKTNGRCWPVPLKHPDVAPTGVAPRLQPRAPHDRPAS